DLVRSRLEALTATSRAVIAAGAVTEDFAPSLLRDLTGQDDAEITAALDAAMSAGLLEVSDGSVGFRHAILREAVLEVTVPHLVDTLHRRAATALAASGEAEARARRARHLLAVGEHDVAAADLTAAAERW